MTIVRKIHVRVARGKETKILNDEPKVVRKVSRSAEIMAFAIVFDDWLTSGRVSDYTEIARITGLSMPSLSKIMTYRLKPTPTQEAIIRGEILG